MRQVGLWSSARAGSASRHSSPDWSGELAPDDVIAVAADLVDDGARVLSAVLDSLGEATLAGESVEALIEAALVGRRVAIVIDGADSIVDDVLAWSAQVPADGNGPWVIVASRVHPFHVVSPVVHLGPLSLGKWLGAVLRGDVVPVLVQRAGGAIDHLDAAAEAVQRVLATTGGVPLAIRVAAATSAAVGLDASEAIIAEGAGSDAVAESIHKSVSLLASSEREVFDAFAVSSGTIDAEARGGDRRARSEIDGDGARDTCSPQPRRPRRRRVHDAPARPAVRDSPTRPDSASAARIRHRSWCLSLTTAP